MTGPLPFLRWAGSKRQLLTTLCTYWPADCKRYVEPFVGSACLFFRLQPQSSILGDINCDLIQVYEAVRDMPDMVFAALAVLRKGRDEYTQLRSLDPATLSKPVRAARFIYLNRYCFNGLYRTNKSGQFNVPYGGDRSGSLPTHEQLIQCGRLLERAELVPGDFETVLARAEAGDFVYMDPPFQVNARRVFNEYHAKVFTVEDLARLRKSMLDLDAKGIKFLVSYAECEEASVLRDGFSFTMTTVKRNISGFAEKRGPSNELLITNYSIFAEGAKTNVV